MTTKIQNLPLLNYRMSLHCPAPTKKRKDKEDQLTAQAGAERGAIRVQQERIPEKWQKPISACQAKIRAYFDKNAFRLNDSYSIPVSQYDSFEAGYQHLLKEHEVLVGVLCDAIASGEIIEEAKRRAGEDFIADFLPTSCDAVRSAIHVNIHVSTDLSSPVINQALADLADETRKTVEERVRTDMEKAEAEGQSSLVSFVMDEIVAYLRDIQDRCSTDGKGKHFKTLMDKFVRITQRLPSYNVTGNPVVSNAIQRVYDAFKELDKETLRDNEEYRKETLETAKNLLADITDENIF